MAGSSPKRASSDPRRSMTGRMLLAAALACGATAAVLIAASRAPAQQQGGGQVTITPVSGGAKSVVLAQAEGNEDVDDRPYTLRSGAGENTEHVTGFSLRKLLELADIDTFGFTYAEIARPGGGAVLLSRHQVLQDGAFADGPPVVYRRDGGLAFLRPSSGGGDLNADDSFVATDGDVRLALRDGELLDVDVSASPLRTKPGKPVRFSATVAQSGAGEQLTYSWFFSDGTSSRGPQTTHRFKRPGSYNVVVGVTAPGNEVGASESVRVQIGEPRPGPDRTGGGKSDASPLDSGPSTGGSGSGPVASPSPASPASPGGSKSQQAPPPPPADLVEGQLLDSDAERPLEDAPATESNSSRAAARSGDPEGGGFGVPDAALGLLTAMGMLGGGALLELRGVRRLRTW
jgi:hypothetical protein